MNILSDNTKEPLGSISSQAKVIFDICSKFKRRPREQEHKPITKELALVGEVMVCFRLRNRRGDDHQHDEAQNRHSPSI